jgi:hypothetical protein
MHIRRLITIAETPKIMIRSLKKGIVETVSWLCVTGFLDSNLLRKIKSKKAMLQINVNRERKEITFIGIKSLKIVSPK